MRKPYPLLNDLLCLILESDHEPQRHLSFPLFRHVGTRTLRRARPWRGRGDHDAERADYGLLAGGRLPGEIAVACAALQPQRMAGCTLDSDQGIPSCQLRFEFTVTIASAAG